MCPALARTLSCQIPGRPKWDPSLLPHNSHGCVHPSTLEEERNSQPSRDHQPAQVPFSLWGVPTSPLSYSPKWRGKAQPQIGSPSIPYVCTGSSLSPWRWPGTPFVHSFNNAWPDTLIPP